MKRNCKSCLRIVKTIWGWGCEPIKTDINFNWAAIIKWRKDNKDEMFSNALNCPGWRNAHTYDKD